jgi:hypothetical protein
MLLEAVIHPLQESFSLNYAGTDQYPATLPETLESLGWNVPLRQFKASYISNVGVIGSIGTRMVEER